MSLVVDLALLVACLIAAAVFAGAETAFYRASPVRLEMEARAGGRAASIAQRLVRDRTALIVVLVLGVNLALEILAWRTESVLRSRGASGLLVDLVLGLVLVPTVFFAAELVPKELCRRRPHAALRFAAPLVLAARVVLWPLVAGLAFVARVTARATGGQGLESVAQGREAVLGFLREGQQSGAIPAHAEEMARNVLLLRSIPVSRCMVPWSAVVRIAEEAAPETAYVRVAHALHTRIPVVRADGTVLGYVHQLDVLGDGESMPFLERLRPIPEIPPDLPVDRALARLRAAGQRMAVVGTRAAPLGIVTLKDLLEEISGDLARW